MTRRLEAGDALHFAEDVPTYEDLECYSRLCGRGLAGFMDCETTWQRSHPGDRLTDAGAITRADTAMKIIGRVWGADEEYLRLHRDEFEAAMDSHRAQKVRHLLANRQRLEARRELARFFHTPRSYVALTYIASAPLKVAIDARRRAIAARQRWSR